MTKETIDIFERLATLEANASYTEKKIEDLEKELHDVNLQLSQFNKLAAKAGGIIIGFAILSVIIGSKFSAVSKKIVEWMTL